MLGLEMATFGIDDGYVEAICRSLRKGFISEQTYLQLKSCSDLMQFKQVLEDTDYKGYIENNQWYGYVIFFCLLFHYSSVFSSSVLR